MVTYARIVVDYRPQKDDPNRVSITAGGNFISYPFELTTRTADLTTSKLLWNSTISTRGARYMCADAKNFHLATPLDRYEYMKMPIDLIPPKFIELNNLSSKIKNGYIYMKIMRGMYGLPQSGILANNIGKPTPTLLRNIHSLASDNCPVARRLCSHWLIFICGYLNLRS